MFTICKHFRTPLLLGTRQGGLTRRRVPNTESPLLTVPPGYSHTHKQTLKYTSTVQCTYKCYSTTNKL